MTFGAFALVCIFAAVLVALAGEIRQAWREASRGFAVLTTAMALSLTAAVMLTVPSFLHANFHANALLESIAAFPADPSHRATYGRASFLLLGALSAPFGHRLEAIAVINHGLLAAAVTALGVLAWRLSGRLGAGVAAVAAGATFVPLLRVAGSEDAHVTAAFFGAIALLFADVYGASRRTTALAIWVGASVLMIHARQTFYVWAPLSIALVWARGGLRGDRRAVGGALVIATALALRIGATLGDESERISVAAIPVLASDPDLAGDLFAHHPLLDIRRFALAHLPLLVTGFAALVRGGRSDRALAGGFALAFAVTLPFGFPVPGVELAFRTPAALLAIPIAGIGVDAVARRLRGDRRRDAATTAGAALLVAVPLLLPGAALFTWQSADWLEFRAVRDLAPHLPRRVRVVDTRAREPAPSYHPPIRALVEAGVDARRAGPDPNPDREAATVVILGVRCYGRSLLEDLGIESPATLDRQGFRRIFAAIADPPPTRTEERPECGRARAVATPIGPSMAVGPLADDLPFVRYGRRTVPVQIAAVDPRVLQEESAE